MNKFFQYFSFTSVERKGFIVLCAFVLLINTASFIYQQSKNNDDISYNLYQLDDVDIVDDNLEHSANKSYYKRKLDNSEKSKFIEYFEFDPNVIDESQWLKLGLSAKQTKVITNYTAKGGKFYKNEDLKKIYSITDKDYIRLEPYIRIGNLPSKYNKEGLNQQNHLESKKSLNVKISLNTADTTQLKSLNGIGSVLSNRIVKFRDALGGFYSSQQLHDVYGISPEALANMIDKVEVDANLIKKINVNTSSVQQLQKHPYINKKLALAIVNYRDQHGFYNEMDDLEQNRALDKEFLRKIAPYLEY